MESDSIHIILSLLNLKLKRAIRSIRCESRDPEGVSVVKLWQIVVSAESATSRMG